MGRGQIYQKTSTYTESRNFTSRKNSKEKKITDVLKNEYIKLFIIVLCNNKRGETIYMFNKGLVKLSMLHP